jgi:hypothetical protein
VDWLHKALNSPNILFFPRYDTPAWEWARTPYIVGFTRSRQNRKHAFTEGPAEWREFKDYQHPQYLENCERFREEFDYDSHGILLLEIGLWNSLSALTSSKGFVGLTPTQFAQRLVEKRIPQLGLAMGTNYARRRVFVSRETSAWTLL